VHNEVRCVDTDVSPMFAREPISVTFGIDPRLVREPRRIVGIRPASTASRGAHPMSNDPANDGREIESLPDEAERYDPVVDEFGVLQSIGSISVGDLIYRATDEFEAGTAGSALARMAQDSPAPAEGELLTLRYIAASRARDEAAMADIAQLVGEPTLTGNLVKLVTAAWMELSYDPDEILASLTGYALTDICGSVADG
jgi:hypothetical protein